MKGMGPAEQALCARVPCRGFHSIEFYNVVCSEMKNISDMFRVNLSNLASIMLDAIRSQSFAYLLVSSFELSNCSLLSCD